MVGLGSMRVKILSDDNMKTLLLVHSTNHGDRVLSLPKINGSVNLQSGWPISAPTSSI